jgi:hypothetical protein
MGNSQVIRARFKYWKSAKGRVPEFQKHLEQGWHGHQLLFFREE